MPLVMEYEISAQPGFLRAKLSGRETVEEMRAFLRTVFRECNARQTPAVLLDIRGSRPIFQIEPRRFFEDLRRLAGNGACRIALLGDNPELRLSNEYLALLARQQGLDMQSFRFEVAALKYLTDRRKPKNRRHPSDRRQRTESRASEQRRRRERRIPRESLSPAF